MQSSSQGYRGYQGYPAVNPIVTDVPTIDLETASRWANLPRRQVHLPGPSRMPPGSSGAGPSRPPVTSGGSNSQNNQRPPAPTEPVSSKQEIDDNPRVYIDLPQASSHVSQINSPENQEPEFVQETIMYNPFDNIRIDTPKEETISGEHLPHCSTRPNQNRPNTLDIASPGMGSNVSSNRPTPTLPDFLSKQSLVYGGDGVDGFPVSPIPVSEFPLPPPAYTEVAVPQPQRPIENRPAPQPPRTQVIVNEPINPVNPISVQAYDRKNLICHHCGVRVHSVVFRQVGCLTHIFACIAFVFFMPAVILVYLLDVFKYKNHYCPHCNQFIGYVRPVLDRDINYVT